MTITVAIPTLNRPGDMAAFMPTLRAQTLLPDQFIVVDAGDPSDLAGTGVIPGSVNISLGTLFYKADQAMPEGVKDARLADKSQEIFVTCARGGQASIAAGVLADYGYNNVSVIDGGIVGWKEAGLDVEEA